MTVHPKKVRLAVQGLVVIQGFVKGRSVAVVVPLDINSVSYFFGGVERLAELIVREGVPYDWTAS